jgi:hypothetical protein
MNSHPALIVTSISRPNQILSSLAEGARKRNIPFYVIGDVPSPADFYLEGCDFYSLSRQAKLDFRTSAECPQRHYARKNIGYLLAIQNGAEIIIETDDDNQPRDSFWNERVRKQSVPGVQGTGWINGYAYFSDLRIWPRGLPLDAVQNTVPTLDHLPTRTFDCPIQQGLADGNPDVDAIYRLVLPLPVQFRNDRRVAFANGAWCPFNSQNTTWWADAFPLLYLPAYCSFRMTDTWRSFVAQRIAWASDWSILFTEPTVWQERNDHNLLRDFRDEVPGYLHNRRIGEVLEELTITPGLDQIPDNLRICYEALIQLGVVEAEESKLLDAWLADLAALKSPAKQASAALSRF